MSVQINKPVDWPIWISIVSSVDKLFGVVIGILLLINCKFGFSKMEFSWSDDVE